MWIKAETPTPFSVRKSGISIDTNGGIVIDGNAIRLLNLNQSRYEMIWLEITRTDRSDFDILTRFGTANSSTQDTMANLQSLRADMSAIVSAMYGFGGLSLADANVLAVLPGKGDGRELAGLFNRALQTHDIAPRMVSTAEGIMDVAWATTGVLRDAVLASAMLYSQNKRWPSIGMCCLPRCSTLFSRARAEAMYCSGSCRVMAQREGLAKTKVYA